MLAGQSNMAGRGGVTNRVWDGHVPSEAHCDAGTVWRLNANMGWEEAHEPLHADIDTGKTCGIGPGLVFAAEVIRQHRDVTGLSPPERIGLVPCAVGGTAIREWDSHGFLYRSMVGRTRGAMEGGATLRAILWYQGESDTETEEQVESYRGRLEALVTRLREDVNHPDLPFIQVGVVTGNLPTTQYLERLREAQRSVQLRGVFYVDSFGLTLQADQLHLTAESQVELGKRLAITYLKDVFPHLR